MTEEYFKKQKELWRKSLQRPSQKELLEIFPEAKKIIPKKLKETRAAKNKEEKRIIKKLEAIKEKNSDSFSAWFYKEYLAIFHSDELEKLNNRVARLKSMKELLKDRRSEFENLKEQVERAREFSIEELARSHLDLKPVGDKFVGLCPFHNEKTPSFYIYPETNTFYCFGCQESGDVIKLSMHLYGVNFKDAVRMLQ